MAKHNELGKQGEQIAREYLLKEGYQILECNFYYDRKEIDIIARDRDEIVIVEVKTREQGYFEDPWEAVSPKKIRNLVEAADYWLRENEIDLETRFDVISIVISQTEEYKLDHFKGAFNPPVN